MHRHGSETCPDWKWSQTAPEWWAEVDGVTGVADEDPDRGDLPEIHDECGADVPLEAQPRSGHEEARRVWC